MICVAQRQKYYFLSPQMENVKLRATSTPSADARSSCSDRGSAGGKPAHGLRHRTLSPPPRLPQPMLETSDIVTTTSTPSADARDIGHCHHHLDSLSRCSQLMFRQRQRWRKAGPWLETSDIVTTTSTPSADARDIGHCHHHLDSLSRCSQLMFRQKSPPPRLPQPMLETSDIVTTTSTPSADARSSCSDRGSAGGKPAHGLRHRTLSP
ncbi:hypothetical protein B0T16DRAFT_11394 [Cercophora newfieldiana]|uniref:Uncharacterized protein n=1 Tax=Cercophora newfieldiana TaxID=92897 RepID=A0AA40CXR0_9PEZI|nr:hypothetical protein B0T16DRAFT_11394 [Cercophora newfieldiana]